MTKREIAMSNKADKPQDSKAQTEAIDEKLPSAERKRLKTGEQREIALSGGDDPLGQPAEVRKRGKFSDEVER